MNSKIAELVRQLLVEVELEVESLQRTRQETLQALGSVLDRVGISLPTVEAQRVENPVVVDKEAENPTQAVAPRRFMHSQDLVDIVQEFKKPFTYLEVAEKARERGIDHFDQDSLRIALAKMAKKKRNRVIDAIGKGRGRTPALYRSLDIPVSQT